MDSENEAKNEEVEKSEVAVSYVLPMSIVLGAVIISASMFYNTNVLLRKFANSSIVSAGASAQEQGAVLGAQADSKPVVVPQRADAAVLGNKSSQVTMVEFTDFQCPYCQRFFQDTYGQLKAKYIDTGKIKFVSRHYPLPFHQNAQKAAEAAECSNRQGKYAEYHDLLFTKGESDGTGLNVPELKQYAQDLGLNTTIFNTCLDKGEAAEVVKKDLADGQGVGVGGTPTFFINGKRVVGALPYTAFEQAIEQALQE